MDTGVGLPKRILIQTSLICSRDASLPYILMFPKLQSHIRVERLYQEKKHLKASYPGVNSRVFNLLGTHLAFGNQSQDEFEATSLSKTHRISQGDKLSLAEC